MGTNTLKNFRTTSDVKINTALKDGGIYVDWSEMSDIKAWLWSDAQKALAGRCDVRVDAGDGANLICEYASTKAQYPGVNRLIVQATYMGATKTYDKPVFNFVRWTADQAGEQITIDDPEVDVTIEATDVSSSILQNAIAAALAAAEHAEHAASLVPLQVLQDCEQATEEAREATEEADAAAEHATPYIGENGHWWRWDKAAGAYVDTGEVAQGPTGNGIQSVEQTQTSEESEGENVVTVTMTDGTQAQFTIRNGKQGTRGIQGVPGVANAKYKQVDTLPTAGADTMDFIYLTPSQTAGVYDMSYTEQDGNSYTWKPLGTTAIQLSDYATKTELNELQEEIYDSTHIEEDKTTLDPPKITNLIFNGDTSELQSSTIADRKAAYIYCENDSYVYVSGLGLPDYKVTIGTSSSIPAVGVALDDTESFDSSFSTKRFVEGGLYCIIVFHASRNTGMEYYVAEIQDMKDAVQEIKDGFVEKEEGKSLIDAEFASEQKVKDNPEYLNVITDSEGKIIEGIKADGTKVIQSPLELQAETKRRIDNPEYLDVVTDANGRIIEGTRIDGKKVFPGGVEGLDKDIEGGVYGGMRVIYSRMFNPKIDLQKANLKILSIGNSFTLDATHYLPNLVNDGGLIDHFPNNFSIYRVGRSYASFADWDKMYHDIGTREYGVYKVCGFDIPGIEGVVDPSEEIPVDGYGSLFRNAIKNGDWDIIIIQQLHDFATHYELWNGTTPGGFLKEFIRDIRMECPKASIGYLMPHSPNSDYGTNHWGSTLECWKKTVDATEKLSRNYDVDFIIPYGTAIQNLRGTSLCDQYEFSTDSLHLADGIGDYCAACCYYQSIFGPRFGTTIFENTWRKTDFDESVHGVKNINDENALLAQKAAFAAVYNRFEITNIE